MYAAVKLFYGYIIRHTVPIVWSDKPTKCVRLTSLTLSIISHCHSSKFYTALIVGHYERRLLHAVVSNLLKLICKICKTIYYFRIGVI